MIAQCWAVRKLVLKQVFVSASFVPLECAMRSGSLESHVRPDRADRYFADGDNHRSGTLNSPQNLFHDSRRRVFNQRQIARANPKFKLAMIETKLMQHGREPIVIRY